jgi:8-oxo-dGTP pyrophosphatase MutT (NUDIX family)
MECVQVVLFNNNGEVLGVSRKTNHEDFGLCGGKIDPEDSGNPETAIIREAKEETGLDIYNLRLIHSGLYRGTKQYTYIADWRGEIKTSEPHVVKFTNFGLLNRGTFGDYNTKISKILSENGILFVL